VSKKRLIENALSMGAVQLVSLGLPLLSLPYLATVLGAQQLGRMAFALSVAQILVILTDYGFNLSASKAVSVNRHNPEKIAEIWCSVTMVRALLALAGLVSIGISALIFDRARNELLLFVTADVMVLGNIMYPQWLFQGLEKLKVISIIQLIARIIVFALIFILVKTSSDIYTATFLQAGGYLFGGTLALPLILDEIGIKRVRWPGSRAVIEQFKDGWHVFLSTAANNTYTTSNTFFLGLFIEPVSLAYYHIAEKIIRAIQTLNGPVSNAIYPYVTQMAAGGYYDELMRFNRKLFFLLGLANILICMTVYFVSPFAIDYIFGSAYKPLYSILQILLLVPVIIVAGNVFGIQTMLPLGMEAGFSKILLWAAVINFIIFIPSSYWFGVIGGAWANVVIELFVACSMAFVLQKESKNPLVYKKEIS